MQKEKTKIVLTRDDPRWQTFCRLLNAALSERGCHHDQRSAEIVLQEMGGIDIESTLAYFDDNGGYCDCEILLNVDKEWSWMAQDEALPGEIKATIRGSQLGFDFDA